MIPNFMSQFKRTKDADTDHHEAICHLAAMPPDVFLQYMEELWDDMGKTTTMAVSKGMLREPDAREINVLLKFAYRCIAMAELFKTLREQGVDIEPSQRVLDDARDQIARRLRDVMDE